MQNILFVLNQAVLGNYLSRVELDKVAKELKPLAIKVNIIMDQLMVQDEKAKKYNELMNQFDRLTVENAQLNMKVLRQEVA